MDKNSENRVSDIISRFRNPALVLELVNAIKEELPVRRHIKIMHVCGSHEHSVQRWGLRGLLPDGLEVIAGPGCPVCVCPTFEVGEAITLARKGIVIATYGDMIRVPTPYGSLLEEKAAGADIRVVYSPLDALRLARKYPDREFVFFSVGFETTVAPAAAIIASGDVPENLSLLTSHRLTPPAMELLISTGDVNIDGFIAPGHVSVIVGADAWDVFPKKYRMPVVVAGFEPVNILLGIVMILRQIKKGKVMLENAYPSVVKKNGNPVALRAIEDSFDIVPSWWRGFGEVPRSGLVLKSHLEHIDARKRHNIKGLPEKTDLPQGCSCHLVMLGKIYPYQCPLFNTRCTPTTPYGPCMVSQEGTCLIWSKFRSV